MYLLSDQYVPIRFIFCVLCHIIRRCDCVLAVGQINRLVGFDKLLAGFDKFQSCNYTRRDITLRKTEDFSIYFNATSAPRLEGRKQKKLHQGRGMNN